TTASSSCDLAVSPFTRIVPFAWSPLRPPSCPLRQPAARCQYPSALPCRSPIRCHQIPHGTFESLLPILSALHVPSKHHRHDHVGIGCTLFHKGSVRCLLASCPPSGCGWRFDHSVHFCGSTLHARRNESASLFHRVNLCCSGF